MGLTAKKITAVAPAAHGPSLVNSMPRAVTRKKVKSTIELLMTDKVLQSRSLPIISVAKYDDVIKS